MNGPNPLTERHVRILIESLVREGKSEREIVAAVRRVHDDEGVGVRTRRLRYFG